MVERRIAKKRGREVQLLGLLVIGSLGLLAGPARIGDLGPAASLGFVATAQTANQPERASADPSLDQPLDEVAPDLRIRRNVERALSATWAVPADSIATAVADGIVTLSGSVPHLLAKDQATRAAEAVRGVRAIVNRVEVRPLARSDAFLRERISRALAADPVVEAEDITVDVLHGEVTLSGPVGSIVEQRAAVQAAKRIVGVLGVRNLLDLVPELDRPDERIEEEVKRRLRYDALVVADRIAVDVEGGHVRLSGRVPCAAERRRAETDASVPGVRSVHVEDLVVDPDMDRAFMHRADLVASDSPSLAEAPSDEEIEQAIVASLFQDPRIGVDLIEVEVDEGVAFLQGQVERPREVRLAEENARHTVGVLAVRNHLSVRPPQRPSDRQLQGAAEEALQANAYVNGDSIEVAVHGGLIYLFGTVADHGTVREAIEVLESVPGAVAVLNNLRVLRNGSEMSDEELRKRVQWLIEGSALIKADEVVVLSNTGTVSLRGDVQTWTGRAVAEDLAYRAGALSVINRLQVSGTR